MAIKTIALVAGFALATISPWASTPGLAQTAAALSGEVSSAQEGTMEGVVVSAKKDGSTVTVSVVSDANGHFRHVPSASALSLKR